MSELDPIPSTTRRRPAGSPGPDRTDASSGRPEQEPVSDDRPERSARREFARRIDCSPGGSDRLPDGARHR